MFLHFKRPRKAKACPLAFPKGWQGSGDNLDKLHTILRLSP